MPPMPSSKNRKQDARANPKGAAKKAGKAEAHKAEAIGERLMQAAYPELAESRTKQWLRKRGPLLLGVLVALLVVSVCILLNALGYASKLDCGL